MVTAGQRRQAVRQLEETFGVSQRCACRVLGQPVPRSGRLRKPPEEEERLVRRMLERVRQHPRWGYRRSGVASAGRLRVNRKRVYRLWRQKG